MFEDMRPLNFCKTIGICSILLFSLFALSASHHAIAQGSLDKARSEIVAASATWALDSEGPFESSLDLFVDKSQDSIEIFVTLNTETGNSLLGHYFTEDGNIFPIGKNLDRAVLSPIDVDVCDFELLDENGDCTKVIQTLHIEADWTGLGAKVFSNEQTRLISFEREMILFGGTARAASATGSINGITLDDSFFGFMSATKSLAINFGEPSKTPSLDMFGNKGTIAASGTWTDVTVDGRTATVLIGANKEIRGDLSIELLILFHNTDGSTEIVQGHLVLPEGSAEQNVFSMDMRAATAELSPVNITVCNFELEGECSGDPSTVTYTIEAQWAGIEDTALALHSSIKAHSSGSKTTIDSDSVVMSAQAIGSIEGQNLGDSQRAQLFHFSNEKFMSN